MRITKKKTAVIGGVAAVALTGGVAFAYWTSAGTGTGTVTTDTDTPFRVTITSSAAADLSPNGPIRTVPFTVKNEGTGVQRVRTAVASVTSTSNPGCTAADFAIVDTPVPANTDLAAGGIYSSSFTIQMIDTGVNQDACKNVTVNLKVEVG